MIRVYFLQVEIIDGAEKITGIDLIHDALLECTEVPDVRKLTMDTSDAEDVALVAAGAVPAAATQEDIDRYNSRVIILPPDPDIERVKELLAGNPQPLTQPEMWELMHIFGRLLRIPD